MYYQKLESLKVDPDMKGLDRIIESLDTWLALTPKRYQDKLLPERFSKDEGIDINIGAMLFDRLMNLEIIKEQYYLRCECGNTISIFDDVNDALSSVVDYNNENNECDFCGHHETLTTDNLVIVYELIEVPAKELFGKKKTDIWEGISERSNTLSDAICRNPQAYSSIVNRDLLEKAIPDRIRDKVRYMIQ